MRSLKDPSAFSIAQLSLHCMGFFADAQNDSRVNLEFFPARRRRGFTQNDY